MNIGNLFTLNGKIETEVLSVCCVQFAPIGAQTVEELDENTQTMLDYLDLAVSAFPGVDLVVFRRPASRDLHRSTLKMR